MSEEHPSTKPPEEVRQQLHRLAEQLASQETKLSSKEFLIESLNRLFVRLNEKMDLLNIGKGAVSSISEIINAQKCSIFLYNPEEDELEMLANNHIDPNEAPILRIPVEQSELFRKAIRENRPLVIGDVETEIGIDNKSKYKNSSCLITLLKVENRLVGVVSINDKNDNTAFDHNDLQVSKTLNDHIALSISNALLYRNIHDLAIRDALTGLFVPQYFTEVLSREILRAGRYGMPLSLIMVAIDNFKSLNHKHGYLVGDKALKDLGEIMLEQSRKSDYPCRIGGEEFAIILTNTGMDGAPILANRLRERISLHRVNWESLALELSVSVSAAGWSPTEDDKTLIAKARDALETAQEEGGNRVKIAKWTTDA